MYTYATEQKKTTITTEQPEASNDYSTKSKVEQDVRIIYRSSFLTCIHTKRYT